MSIAKVIEVISEGASVEEAVKNGVKNVAKTVTGIKSVYIKETQALVKNNEVTNFRLILKVTFVVDL